MFSCYYYLLRNKLIILVVYLSRVLATRYIDAKSYGASPSSKSRLILNNKIERLKLLDLDLLIIS